MVSFVLGVGSCEEEGVVSKEEGEEEQAFPPYLAELAM